MARVAGVDLPKNKRIDVALQYLYGVGETRAKVVIAKLNGTVKPETRVKDLTEEQVVLINNLLLKDFKVEGELRRETVANMARLTEIGSFRGHRHRRNLPCRGQRTKTNARTRRGRRKTVGVGKSAAGAGTGKA
ncbi:MAG: 30S ribosomal protein S13 [Elusimicrobia bacterium CG11_big_fil_rev_8_21_14_0_20_64_6]|nr:MAG: 30S ribosomal protein S13 [Elusimicrobia bacterium CG11_big_fil_rev_8_21_14_0_20_64_6]